MFLLRKLFNLTLNNVIFGIALMVLIAAYIAIGSGVVSVREHFEMNELEFFDTWVLKALMVLLCASLMVVTWNRIPLTPPRYGVWCIHSGIITLIMGVSLYYHNKIEGRTVLMPNQTTIYYYDTAERALYARVAGSNDVLAQPLPSLPRFNTYSPDPKNTDRLSARDLTHIDAMRPVSVTQQDSESLSSQLGLKDKLQLDIVGFYPFAVVDHDVEENPASEDSGVELSLAGEDGSTAGTLLLSDVDPATARQLIGVSEVEHRAVSDSDLELMKQAARQMLELHVSLPGKSDQTIDVQIGSEYSLPESGYHFKIDSYNPDFPMFETHEHVKALTIEVTSDAPAPKNKFWRMILMGKEIQTDFKMDPAITPPMVKGNRQKTPIDPNLQLGFVVADPAALMPSQGEEKHTLITSGDRSLIDIHTSFDRPTEIKDLSNGGQIAFALDQKNLVAKIRRLHTTVTPRVTEVPEARRDRDVAESGQAQVVLVRLTCGNWTSTVPIPFDQYAIPKNPETNEPVGPDWRWQMGYVSIPGASRKLELQLGNMYHPLPAHLMLKKLELKHYTGGQGETGMMRSVSSTVVLTDAVTGDPSVAVCELNAPIYYDGGKYLFFQAAYDAKGGWSIIGVGNRPGVGIMIIGCIMIVVGLLYAFYVKPLIIRNMKARALERAGIKRTVPELQTENAS